jgi:hypothetical protein
MIRPRGLARVICNFAGQVFGIANHDVAPYPGDQEALGNDRMNSMLTLLLQSSIFVAGFLVGYAARAWRSHRRQTQFATLAPRTSTFGHPRRAF